MNDDYCIGIAYGTGCIISNDMETYLVVRNLDKWYIDIIAKETGYKSFESVHNFERDGKNQWCVKARNVHSLPALTDLKNPRDFCRSYIELHGTVDIKKSKNRSGICISSLRLRIYGRMEILSFINKILPVRDKTIQNIINKTGRTYALYFQSRNEILTILQWIDGSPKNQKIWDRWYSVIKDTE